MGHYHLNDANDSRFCCTISLAYNTVCTITSGYIIRKWGISCSNADLGRKHSSNVRTTVQTCPENQYCLHFKFALHSLQQTTHRHRKLGSDKPIRDLTSNLVHAITRSRELGSLITPRVLQQ